MPAATLAERVGWFGNLAREPTQLRRFQLQIVGEAGSIPSDRDATNLSFQPVSSRDEYASTILTSELPLVRRSGVFGDLTIASVMIGRIVHHTDVMSIKGDSCRLRKPFPPLPRIVEHIQRPVF